MQHFIQKHIVMLLASYNHKTNGSFDCIYCMSVSLFTQGVWGINNILSLAYYLQIIYNIYTKEDVQAYLHTV